MDVSSDAYEQAIHGESEGLFWFDCFGHPQLLARATYPNGEVERRKSISVRLRFQIFTRDEFTCQYCGMKAPDVVLVVDHIVPVSKSGRTTPLNLITCCEPCNQGKTNREFDTKLACFYLKVIAEKIDNIYSC